MHWLALIFLVLSVAQSNQKRLRWFGVVSNLLFILAYFDDVVILISNLLVMALHLKWLYLYENRATIDYKRRR